MIIVKGFDFSSWQDAPDTPAFIDFTKAVAIGAQFAVARAAYGLGADRIFPRGYDESKKAGLITGVYHFVDYRASAITNWTYLLTQLNGRVPAFIGLDLERNDAYWPGGWPAKTENLTTWCINYKDAWKASGIKCPLVMYTNPDTIKQMRASTHLASFATEIPLWLAWYSTSEPRPADFAPWSKWLIWQPTPTAVGHAYGMESGNVDTDTWNGSLDELKAFVKNTPAPVGLTVEERLTAVEQKQKDHGW